MSSVKYGKGGQAPRMVRASSEDEKHFESLVRLGVKFIARTSHPDAWVGEWVHVFSADKSTWWAVCTMANGSDTRPGWLDMGIPPCPECMRLVLARGGLT